MRILNYIKENYIFLFFVFLAFFPTIRILAVGTSSSSNILEFFVSSLPEVCFLVVLIFSAKQFRKTGFETKHFLDKLFFLYVLYNILVGILVANDLIISIYAIRLTYLPMLIYFIASFSRLEFHTFEIILEKIFTFFVWLGIIGLVLYFLVPDVQNYFLRKATNGIIAEYFIIRFTSILWTPVVFSSIATASIIYWFFRFLMDNRRIYVLYLAILFLCLFLSVSRGAMIALVFCILLIGVLKMDWKKLLLVLLLQISMFSVVGFYISNPIEFGAWIIKSSKETVEMKEGVTRVDLWQKSNKNIYKYPFGLGLGNAGHVAARFHSKDNSRVSTCSTDGWYLKLLLETGYIALAFYIAISLLVFWQWWRHFRKFGFDILTFIFVLGCAVNIQNIVSNVLDFYMFSYLYWFIFGIFILKLKRVSNV